MSYMLSFFFGGKNDTGYTIRKSTGASYYFPGLKFLANTTFHSEDRIMTTTVAIINESTVLRNADVAAAIPAFQTQVTRDLLPVWGVNAHVIFTTPTTTPIGAWVIALLDNSDQAGALGYHDITSAGLPLAKVFVKTTMDAGLSWTVTVSHELLEMLLDPETNETVFEQTGAATGTIYARELCDACEDDFYGYKIDGVLVSDFVLPNWFDPEIKGLHNRDFMGHIKTAYGLLPNGYIGLFHVPNDGSGWTQITKRKEGDHPHRTDDKPRCGRWERLPRHLKKHSLAV